MTKDVVWYGSYLLFNSATIFVYLLVAYKGIKYIHVMPDNAGYCIRLFDPRKKDRLLEKQSRRFRLVLTYVACSLGLAFAYASALTNTYMDERWEHVKDASWVEYLTFTLANIGSLFFIYSVYETIQFFIDDESGLYEDGLRFTYKDLLIQEKQNDIQESRTSK